MPLTIQLTPGKQFAEGEKLDRENLNLLGLPSVLLDGTLGASDIDAEAINRSHLSAHAYFYYEEANPGADAIVVSSGSNPPLRSLEAGMRISFKAYTTKTSAATLAVDGLTAKPLYKRGGIALADGDIRAGQVVCVQYVVSALYNSGNGAWVLQDLEGNGTHHYVEAAGTDNYVANYSPAFTTLSGMAGRVLTFKVANANTTAATLTVNGIGPKDLRKYNDAVLEAGDLVPNLIVECIYDATLDHFLIVSPIARVVEASDLRGNYIAILKDRKALGTNGGSISSGNWVTRDLNYEETDAGNIVTLAANQFTLAAGTYRIEVVAPCVGTDTSMLKLYNATDAADVAFGNSVTAVADDVTCLCVLKTRITLAGTKAFEVRFKGSDASGNTNTKLGAPTSYGDYEYYTTVSIEKEQ